MKTVNGLRRAAMLSAVVAVCLIVSWFSVSSPSLRFYDDRTLTVNPHALFSKKDVVQALKSVMQDADDFDRLRQEEYEQWGKVYNPTRILCIIPFVYPEHQDRIKRIQKSWGQRCDGLLWVMTHDNEAPPPGEITVGEVVYVNMTRSGLVKDRHIWEKMYRTWIMVEEEYINQYDWFVKVDDDSYLFVDNLRNFLQFYDTNVPHYFGHTLMFRWARDNIVFNSGIAYVLSRRTLRTVAPVLKTMPRWTSGFRDRCVDRDGAGEDTNMGVCLRYVGINPDNSLDHQNRQRFLPFFLSAHYKQKKDPKTWYWMYKPKDSPDGKNCCAEDLIAIHGFKRTAKDDIEFERLENLYYRKGRDAIRRIEVPPKPSLFLFDNSSLDFEIDEYRNSLNRFAVQEVYQGKKKAKKLLGKITNTLKK